MKLVDLISEVQPGSWVKRDIPNHKTKKSVMWKAKSYQHARSYILPLTPRVARLLNEERRIHCFHITSPNYVAQLDSIQGTKKVISAMIKVPLGASEQLYGIHHAGVGFYLNGTLILKAGADVMSMPDETGRRWIDIGQTTAHPLQKDYRTKLQNDKEWAKAYDSKNHNALIRRHIALTLEWLQENCKFQLRDGVKRTNAGMLVYYLNDDKETGDSAYDEILVNQIELIDAIYSIHDTKEEDVKDIEKAVGKENATPVNLKRGEAQTDVVTEFFKQRGGKFSGFD